MIILGIDTSNAYASVAVSENNNIIYAEKNFEENRQAEKLISLIEHVLFKAALEYKDIDYLAACCGPGSFTGIRIGLAAANGIVLAIDKIKTLNVNNFETINFRIREQYTNFDFAFSLVNAFRGEVYAEIYDKKGLYKKYSTYTYNELRDLILSLDGNIVISGSATEKIFTTSNMPPKNIKVLPRFAYPDARFICKVAHKKIKRGQENEDLIPLYIRKADAKIPTKLI